MQHFYGVVIENVGLHARPASIAVTEAGKYSADITLHYKDKSANLKSIIQVMKVSVPSDGEIEIICDGEDELEAAEELAKILEKKRIIKRIKEVGS